VSNPFRHACPRGGKIYGVLDGRRWSVSSRNQCNSVDRLIDVLLVLIIVFMVVVSMDKDEKAQIAQADQKATAETQQSRMIVIQVVWSSKDQVPSLKINQEDVGWQELETRLAEIYLKRAEKVAFVRGDADVDFQYVADVIDVAHHAGVQRVGLLTKPDM
jgi:biopolymer transport protein TolR